MTSVAYFCGGPKDWELKFKIEDLPPEALCGEVRVDEALYRRRGPVREGVAYYDYVPEAPV